MIGGADWLLWVLYLFCTFIVLWFLRLGKEKKNNAYFYLGFSVKVFGSLAFVFVYVYYYKFGDSFEYYKGAVSLSKALIENPKVYLELLLSDSAPVFQGQMSEYANGLAFSDTSEEWFMVKLMSVFALLSFRSYLVMHIFMAIVSFYGSWKLFKVFSSILPERKNIAFFSAFLIPSVVFWGSGLMKDTITLTGVNMMIYILYFGIIKKQFKLTFLCYFVIWFIIAYKLKSYIVIALIPGVLLTIFYNYRSKINSSALRFFAGPILMGAIFIVGYFTLLALTEYSEKYKVSQIKGNVKGFHSWHTDLGGSAYSLGDIDYSAIGVLKKIPAALNVTFFRPYLWESSNPVVFLSAVESFSFLLLFVSAMYATKFRIRSLLKDQNLLKGMLIFIFVFGFAIGFTSYNFGALARYKIPIFQLFIFTLFYLRFKAKKLT
ncbi:MAG: hypothetical protein R3279_00555 [Putridiphycobacter sp.]|nr:hypothetical protein [Putridiphycobacter sp.]